MQFNLVVLVVQMMVYWKHKFKALQKCLEHGFEIEKNKAKLEI